MGFDIQIKIKCIFIFTFILYIVTIKKNIKYYLEILLKYVLNIR